VDFDKKRRFESVYSNKVKAGRRRTYFFDVRKTKGSDYYLTITESKKKFEGDGYERHKIFLYKEDFNRFVEGLENTINHVKNDLMPDYDYDEYTRRHKEYEENQEAEGNAAAVPTATTDDVKKSYEEDVEDDLSW
jgi:hypothetical protein